jgi:iduronate 2-sulfatase
MPQRFVDMQLPVNKTDVAVHDTPAKNYCNVSLHRCPAAMSQVDYSPAAPLPWAPVPKEKQQEARQLYRAAVSWTDHNVQLLLDTLDTLNLTESTAIVFHGDHGWHLGEHGQWCKQSNDELVARVPLLVHVPWLPQSHGKRIGALVEIVDLMPFTLDLMGLADRTWDFKQLEGFSFLPLLQDPATPEEHWKSGVFTQYPRCNGSADLNNRAREGTLAPWDFPTNNACTLVDPSAFRAMGYSLRTLDYRYTLWLRWDGVNKTALWDQPEVGEELYVHTGDLGDDTDFFENENVAPLKNYATIKADLRGKLRAGWAAALPKKQYGHSEVDNVLV